MGFHGVYLSDWPGKVWLKNQVRKLGKRPNRRGQGSQCLAISIMKRSRILLNCPDFMRLFCNQQGQQQIISKTGGSCLDRMLVLVCDLWVFGSDHRLQSHHGFEGVLEGFLEVPYCWWQPEIRDQLTSWGTGSLSNYFYFIYNLRRFHIFQVVIAGFLNHQQYWSSAFCNSNCSGSCWGPWEFFLAAAAGGFGSPVNVPRETLKYYW